VSKIYPELDKRLQDFIARQHMYFVATAPCLSRDGSGGHVNVSPKGYRDTFAVLGPLTVAYLDLTGSGAETIAHLRQNSQITIMFCSFGRQPKILRLYGTGRVVLPADPDWDHLAGHFPAAGRPGADGGGSPDGGRRAYRPYSAAGPDGRTHPDSAAADGLAQADGADGPEGKRGVGRGNQRAIIVVQVHRIADSCGYAVPLMQLQGERDLLTRWNERRSPDELAEYRRRHNAVSIDGLPALAGAGSPDPQPAPRTRPPARAPRAPRTPAGPQNRLGSSALRSGSGTADR